MAKKTIKIGIAEQYSLIREGLKHILNTQPQFVVVLEAADNKELLHTLSVMPQEALPDIIVLDVNMPGQAYYETAFAIRKKYTSVKILALSANENEYSIIKILKNATQGYITKNAHPNELHAAIMSIYKTGIYYPDAIKGKILEILLSTDEDAFQITKKQYTFLKYCCTEYTYNEIAEKMGMNLRTIDGYREALFKKLKVKNRIGLVLFAIKSGIHTVE